MLNKRRFPLRDGAEPCKYYVLNGTCRFGKTCKFTHPEADEAEPAWKYNRWHEGQPKAGTRTYDEYAKD